MTHGLDAALRLAQQGFRVFPLDEHGTTPVIRDWPQRATTSPDEIRKLWTDATGDTCDYNPAIATGDGIVVLDFDCKDAKPGVNYMRTWDAVGELPESLRATTPSGGKHLIMRAGTDVANSVGKLAPGVDVRGRHGYIVAPGSTTAKGVYAWENGSADKSLADLEPAPAWVIEKAGQPRERKESDTEPLVDLDDESAVKAAADWLKDHAPEAIEGAGGDRTTYEVAAKIKDFGVSQGVALDLMLEHWNETKASPPWYPHELESKISNAYAYGTSPPGVSSAKSEFTPVVLESVADRNMFYVPLAEALERAKHATNRPLVKGLLDQKALSLLYGESNTGKTFIALDIAFHVATGRPWNGRKTEKGGVVYLAAEGGAGIYRRVEAICREKNIPRTAPFALIPCPANLVTGKKDLQTLIALVREVEQIHGIETQFIVIDTLARVMAGGDENSSVDMGAAIRNTDALKETIGAHVMLVHHSGKDKSKGSRGHSSLRPALDSEFEIVDGALVNRKQRDMEYARPTHFALRGVNLGQDEDGDPVTSCVVDIVTASEFEPLPLTGAAEVMREAFEVAARDMSSDEDWRRQPVTTREWEQSYLDLRSDDGAETRKATARYMRSLRSNVAKSGHVRECGRNQWVSAF